MMFFFIEIEEKCPKDAAKHTTLTIFNQKSTIRTNHLEFISNINFLIKKKAYKKVL